MLTQTKDHALALVTNARKGSTKDASPEYLAELARLVSEWGLQLTSQARATEAMVEKAFDDAPTGIVVK